MPSGLIPILGSSNEATWWVTAAVVYIIAMSLWWVLIVPALRRGPSETATLGILWRLSKLVLRLRQNPEFEGLEHFESLTRYELDVGEAAAAQRCNERREWRGSASEYSPVHLHLSTWFSLETHQRLRLSNRILLCKPIIQSAQAASIATGL